MTMTTHRVDARDVLDADATTSRAFSGRVVAVYRRTGPNSWDDYVRVEQDGGAIEVLPGTEIQLENEGAVFRMRRRGEVIVVAWLPGEGELASRGDIRGLFRERCVSDDDPTPEGNLGRWLHGELDHKPETSD